MVKRHHNRPVRTPQSIPSSGPSPSAGALVQPRVAAELAGMSVPDVMRLILDGQVVTERIRGAVYVDLGDVEARSPGGRRR